MWSAQLFFLISLCKTFWTGFDICYEWNWQHSWLTTGVHIHCNGFKFYVTSLLYKVIFLQQPPVYGTGCRSTLVSFERFKDFDSLNLAHFFFINVMVTSKIYLLHKVGCDYYYSFLYFGFTGYVDHFFSTVLEFWVKSHHWHCFRCPGNSGDGVPHEIIELPQYSKVV